MGTMALITGLLGAICAILGIVDAVEVLPDTGYAALTWTFWFMLSAIFLLGTIGFSMGGRGGYSE